MLYSQWKKSRIGPQIHSFPLLVFPITAILIKSAFSFLLSALRQPVIPLGVAELIELGELENPAKQVTVKEAAIIQKVLIIL